MFLYLEKNREKDLVENGSKIVLIEDVIIFT